MHYSDVDFFLDREYPDLQVRSTLFNLGGAIGFKVQSLIGSTLRASWSKV